MHQSTALALLLTIACVAVSGCGGGSSTASAPDTTPDAQRIAAAKATVAGNPLCSEATLGSYYWEIGDKDGPRVSGSVGTGKIDADTVLAIASASKWLFSAYIVETAGDAAANVPFLHFTSGYSNFDNALCAADGTVAECMNGAWNAAEAAGQVFHYDGGHLQQLAINAGLGALTSDGLAARVRSGIGTELALSYGQPQPAGAGRTNARSYAAFLRKLLLGSATPLRLGPLLGSHAVCTMPSSTCNASSAVVVPAAWHYSLGHWVEDDPQVDTSDNFAYSSPGLFGFYPWVDLDRTLYGLIARQDLGLTLGTGYSSVQCGRLIRRAWKTGVAQ